MNYSNYSQHVQQNHNTSVVESSKCLRILHYLINNKKEIDVTKNVKSSWLHRSRVQAYRSQSSSRLESKSPEPKRSDHASRVQLFRCANTDILKIILNLNPSKAHGDDKIRIRMLKTYGNSIELIFNDCLANGAFPSDLKNVS